MAGWGGLGDMLAGGGNLDRQLLAQNATANASYRSAQTDQAMAAAKKSQADAAAAAQKTDLLDQIANAKTKNLLADDLMGTIMAAGAGGDFSSYASGRKTNQEVGLRGTAADPMSTPEERTRALGAIDGKPYSDVVQISPQVTTDITDPLKALTPTPLGDALIGKDSATAALTNAKAQHPEDFRAAVKTPEQIAAEANARKTGQLQAARTMDFPTAKLRMASTDSKFNRMEAYANKIAADEALWRAVGVGRALSSIPGTDAARIRAMIKTLKSQVGFAALQDMRDNSKTGGALGNVSNTENDYLQNSIAALDENLAPEDLREQLQSLVEYTRDAKGRLRQAFMDTYPELGSAAPAARAPVVNPGATAQPAPAADAEGWTTLPNGVRIREKR